MRHIIIERCYCAKHTLTLNATPDTTLNTPLPTPQYGAGLVTVTVTVFGTAAVQPTREPEVHGVPHQHVPDRSARAKHTPQTILASTCFTHNTKSPWTNCLPQTQCCRATTGPSAYRLCSGMLCSAKPLTLRVSHSSTHLHPNYAKTAWTAAADPRL